MKEGLAGGEWNVRRVGHDEDHPTDELVQSSPTLGYEWAKARKVEA